MKPLFTLAAALLIGIAPLTAHTNVSFSAGTGGVSVNVNSGHSWAYPLMPCYDTPYYGPMPCHHYYDGKQHRKAVKKYRKAQRKARKQYEKDMRKAHKRHLKRKPPLRHHH